MQVYHRIADFRFARAITPALWTYLTRVSSLNILDAPPNGLPPFSGSALMLTEILKHFDGGPLNSYPRAIYFPNSYKIPV